MLSFSYLCFFIEFFFLSPSYCGFLFSSLFQSLLFLFIFLAFHFSLSFSPLLYLLSPSLLFYVFICSRFLSYYLSLPFFLFSYPSLPYFSCFPVSLTSVSIHQHVKRNPHKRLNHWLSGIPLEYGKILDTNMTNDVDLFNILHYHIDYAGLVDIICINILK